MQDLNFFSPYVQEKRIANQKNTSVILRTTLTLGIMVSIFIVNYIKINSIETDTAQMGKFLNSPDTVREINEFESKKKKFEVAKQYYDIVQNIENKMQSADRANSEVLKNIAFAMPQKVLFKTLSLDANRVQIQGIADSRTAVAELEYNMKNYTLFDDIHVVSISKEEEESNNYLFTMKCTLKDVENSEAK